MKYEIGKPLETIFGEFIPLEERPEGLFCIEKNPSGKLYFSNNDSNNFKDSFILKDIKRRVKVIEKSLDIQPFEPFETDLSCWCFSCRDDNGNVIFKENGEALYRWKKLNNEEYNKKYDIPEYGILKSKMSIMNLPLYREHMKIINEYIHESFYLATPGSIQHTSCPMVHFVSYEKDGTYSGIYSDYSGSQTICQPKNYHATVLLKYSYINSYEIRHNN